MSARAVRHGMLLEVIAEIHSASRRTYGARRVHAELIHGRGVAVARWGVELVMRRNNIVGLPGRPRWRKIPNQRTAADLVDRRFARDGPDQLWVTDITEHPTREGKAYCAVVLDTFSRPGEGICPRYNCTSRCRSRIVPTGHLHHRGVATTG